MRMDDEQLLQELKQAIREARECLKDFKHLQKEYAQLTNNWTDQVNRQIAADVQSGLEAYKSALDNAITVATDKVFARFDKLASIMMGEDKKHKESLTELAKRKYHNETPQS